MARDPNGRETLSPLNPVRRHLDHAETYGGMKEPGYRCKARRPRLASFDEIVDHERAERIEEIYDGVPGMDEY